MTIFWAVAAIIDLKKYTKSVRIHLLQSRNYRKASSKPQERYT